MRRRGAPEVTASPATLFDATISAMLRQDYVAAIAQLRRMDAIEGVWKYAHSHAGAVTRIETAFKSFFGTDPWGSLPVRALMQWRKEVGYYCFRLGVPALLRDLSVVHDSGKFQPRTLHYFIRSSKDGEDRASRWEMLVSMQIETEWQAAKAAEAEATQGKAPIFNNALTPAWVEEARQTVLDLRVKRRLTPTDRNALEKAASLLKRFGYSK